jgi:hypothetical protein
VALVGVAIVDIAIVVFIVQIVGLCLFGVKIFFEEAIACSSSMMGAETITLFQREG